MKRNQNKDRFEHTRGREKSIGYLSYIDELEDQPEDEKQITLDFFGDDPPSPKCIPNSDRETQIGYDN